MRFLDAWSLQPGFKGHIRRRLISQPTFVIRSARPTLAEVPSAHLSFPLSAHRIRGWETFLGIHAGGFHAQLPLAGVVIQP
jgi:hypothetical protein